jgi:PHO85 cyclin-5
MNIYPTDQAVKSLCEIWHPQGIPSVFATSANAPVTGTPPNDLTSSVNDEIPQKSHNGNTQLPLPVSPSTHTSPCSPPSSVLLPPTAAQISPQSGQEIPATINPRSNLVPIEVFVHEVLRRSGTSGGVLLTALCYLEAIRSKIPGLVGTEAMGKVVSSEIEIDGRNVGAADLDGIDPVAEFGMTLDSIIDTDPTSQASTTLPDISTSREIGNLSPEKVKSPCPPLPPLPPFPSPLLCPRRTFVASLILASKFMQDKCYSNRTWAKLVGLPLREIGQCERALGQALEWRLWVGKVPHSAPAPPTALPTSVRRPVVRSRSESTLVVSPSSGSKFLAQSEPPSMASKSTRLSTSPASSTLGNRDPRRWATLPTQLHTSLTFERSCCTTPEAGRSDGRFCFD